MSDCDPLVLAITGASGSVYARRLLEVVLEQGVKVHLTISPAAKIVFQQELQLEVDLEQFTLTQVLPEMERFSEQVVYHPASDFTAAIASGSFRTRGMVICPCSTSTLSGVAHAASNNLVQRAAEVHLKERRKLILVTRETPLSLPQLDNMVRVTTAGAVVLPASPGWYHGVESLDDIVDFVVGRILDQLGIKSELINRWSTGGGHVAAD